MLRKHGFLEVLRLNLWSQYISKGEKYILKSGIKETIIHNNVLIHFATIKFSLNDPKYEANGQVFLNVFENDYDILKTF